MASPASPQTHPRQALPSVLPPSGQRLSLWWRVCRAQVCVGRGCREGQACFPAVLEPGAQGTSAGWLEEGRC